MTPDFSIVSEFEKRIAAFFGAPFAVAVDSCTHGVELCLRYKKAKYISCPRNTYLSIPMLSNKLNIPLFWRERDLNWRDYYEVYDSIYDAAVLWKPKSYIKGSMMCISMQYQKHLSVGRLGVILVDNKEEWLRLKKMSYDGRLPGVPWRDQNIDMLGFHYYAQPELCTLALHKLQDAIDSKPKQWVYTDWVDLTNMAVFKNKYQKIYNQIIEKAQSENRNKKSGCYYESHHIIPRCLGGEDGKNNRVLLTAKEHFIIHKLLCFMFPDERRFKIALWKMISRKSQNQDRGYKVSSREFSFIKENMALVNKAIQLKRWEDLELRKLQSVKISKAQIESYKQDSTRAKRLSQGQINSYKQSNRAKRLSSTQKRRYQNPQERVKTSLAVKKSRTSELLEKMSKRFSGKNSTTWVGYVYIFNPEGKLEFRFDTLSEAKKNLGSVIIKNNRIGKKGKWKGYKFVISKDKLSFRTKKSK